MSTVAVYGGAFNPPHVGHAMVTSWILWTGLADTVLIVPSCDHPFGKPMASFTQRIAYCLAFAHDVGPNVLVSAVESTLPSPNYTITLLRAIQEQGTWDHVRCVMGADNLAVRSKWHGFDDIVREFDPIYADRAGVVLPEGVVLASPPFPNVSSTEVRRLLATGQPVGHLLTRSVRALVGDVSIAPG